MSKWVFWILTVSFTGWLAVSQVLEYIGVAKQVALEVNGHDITAQEFQLAVREREEQYRAATGRMPTTLDERRELENRVAEEMIQTRLLSEQYERLGIEVRDEEVDAAVRTMPPPELMERSEFQTEGRFDPQKWERFLQTADAQVRLALRARYREAIPQVKLQQYLVSDVYLSDAKLWRLYRDQGDSIRVALLAIWPEALPDTGITVTDAELRRYLAEHEDEYRRPAVAHLSYVAMDRTPNAADSAAARARAAEVRAEAARDREAFERLVQEVSADSATLEQGGDLGWLERNDPRLAPAVRSAVRGLRPGQVSPAVLTEAGHEIIRLEDARGDSVRLRRIVVPVELAGDHFELVEGRADSLEAIADRLAAGHDVLDAARAALGLTVRQARPLAQGDRLVLDGAFVPDVSVWAFEAAAGESSDLIEGRATYYMFRLDSLRPAGVPALAELRDALTEAVRSEKKKTLAGERARALSDQIRSASSLPELGRRLDLPVQTLGPFTRINPPALLQREPRVLGAAFGLAVSERSVPIAGEHGYYVVELLNRKPADSTAWAAQRDAQRGGLLAAARQQRVSQYMSDLRETADIVDRRQELLEQAAREAGQQAAPPLF